MTKPQDVFAEYPEQVRGRTLEPSAVYELIRDRYALHRRASSEDADDDKAIEIIEGKPEDQATAAGRVAPVYILRPAGSFAAPTGLVFIRFKSGETAAERKSDIEGAGYEIEQSVEYAPEAAWLRHRSDDIAKALNGISELEKISGVENVEPQMLMRRASR